MIKKIILLLLLSNIVLLPVGFAQTLAERISVEDGGVIEGKDGWLFLKEELEHMTAGPFWGPKAAEVSKAAKKEFADPLPAVIDFQQQLNALNIDLLFVPVPPKGLVYHDKLPVDASKEVALLNTVYDEFYKLLQKEGVDVVDLRQLLIAHRLEEDVYCKTDTHYSGAGISLVADALAKRLSEKKWYPEIAKISLERTTREVEITGDLLKMAGKDGSENLELDFVVDGSTGGVPKEFSGSPILLLGDSHTLVFSTGGDLHASGAGLFENLSAELQVALDRIGVRGSGATPSRIKLYQKARRDPAYLDNKKVVVWCFTAREFTGIGGWRKVPVKKGNG